MTNQTNPFAQLSDLALPEAIRERAEEIFVTLSEDQKLQFVAELADAILAATQSGNAAADELSHALHAIEKNMRVADEEVEHAADLQASEDLLQANS